MKKYFLFTAAVILVCIAFCFGTWAEAASLYPAEDEEYLWGYINDKGEWVIEPQYEDADDFCGEYAIVLKLAQEESEEKTYEIINTKGETIVRNIRGIDDYAEGNPYIGDRCYWVYGYEKTGDRDDEFIAKGCFDWQTGKRTELDPETDYEFEHDVSVNGNIVSVISPEGAYGFYDLQTERLVIEPQFDLSYIWDIYLSWNDCTVIQEYGEGSEYDPYYYITAEGTVVPLPETLILPDSEGGLIHAEIYVAGSRSIVCITKDDRYILLDYEGHPVTGVLQDYLDCRNGNIMISKDGELYQCIKPDGSVLFEGKYRRIEDVWTEGYLAVQTTDGQNMIIREDGTCAAELPVPCSAGCTGEIITAYIEWDDEIGPRWFLFDRKNETVKEINVRGWIESITENGTVLYKSDETELYGFMDADGNCLQEAIYEVDEDYHEGFMDFSDYAYGMICVIKDGKAGYINEKGETVIPCQYEDAQQFKGELALVETEGHDDQYINHKGEVVFVFGQESDEEV